MAISSLKQFLVLLKKTKKYVRWHITSEGAIRGHLKSSLRLGALRFKAYAPEEDTKAWEIRICPVTAVALLKGKLLDQSMTDWATDLFESESLMKEIIRASDFPEVDPTNYNPTRDLLLNVLF